MKSASPGFNRTETRNDALLSNVTEEEVLIFSAVESLLYSFEHVKLLESSFETSSRDSETLYRIDLSQVCLHRAAKLFLTSLENTANVLGLKMISRKYRQGFTRNYRLLMPCDQRLYRIDVLEAGQENHNFLWVNGERYDLCDEVTKASNEFRETWSALLCLLSTIGNEMKAALKSTKVVTQICHSGSHTQENPYLKRDWLALLGPSLVKFDKTWTLFERHYIQNLIWIEKLSRRLLMECVYAEEELRLYEQLFEKFVSTPSALDETQCMQIQQMSYLKELSSIIRSSYIDFLTKLSGLQKIITFNTVDPMTYRFTTYEEALYLYQLNHRETEEGNQRLLGGHAWFYYTESYSTRTQRVTDKQTLLILPGIIHLVKDMRLLRDVFYKFSLNPERIDPYITQNLSLVSTFQHFHLSWKLISPYLEDENKLEAFEFFLWFLSYLLQIYRKFCFDHSKQQAGSTPQDNIEKELQQPHATKLLSLSHTLILFVVSSFSNTPDHIMPFKVLLPEIYNDVSDLFNGISIKPSPFIFSVEKDSQLNLFGLHGMLTQKFSQHDVISKRRNRGKNNFSNLLMSLIQKGSEIANVCSSTQEESLQLILYIIHRSLITHADLQWRLKTLKRFTLLPHFTRLLDDFITTFEECTSTLQQLYSVESNTFFAACLNCA